MRDTHIQLSAVRRDPPRAECLRVGENARTPGAARTYLIHFGSPQKRP